MFFLPYLLLDLMYAFRILSLLGENDDGKQSKILQNNKLKTSIVAYLDIDSSLMSLNFE